MLEGLPPNNAAHRLTLVSDERRARAVADLIVESFEPAEAASTAFETEESWPGGGKAWLVEAYFGVMPNEEAIRALIAVAADEETARSATFGLTEKQDWVANALAGLQPVRAGRFLVHGAHDRGTVGASDVGIEIEAGLAFGTGHHGTTRGCLLHLDRLLKRRRPEKVVDVGCGAGVLAIAAAKVLKRKVELGDIDPVAVEVANANARLNGVGQFCKAISVARGREPRLARGRALRRRVRQHPGKTLAPARALAGFCDCAGWRGDRLGPTQRRRARRARRVASAGLFPRRTDRSRGLGEPEADKVKWTLPGTRYECYPELTKLKLRSRFRRASFIAPIRNGIDEALVVDGVRAPRDRERLSVRLFRECRCADVGNPNLDRAQPLRAQSLSVRPHLVP